MKSLKIIAKDKEISCVADYINNDDLNKIVIKNLVIKNEIEFFSFTSFSPYIQKEPFHIKCNNIIIENCWVSYNNSYTIFGNGVVFINEIIIAAEKIK